MKRCWLEPQGIILAFFADRERGGRDRAAGRQERRGRRVWGMKVISSRIPSPMSFPPMRWAAERGAPPSCLMAEGRG